LLPIEWAIEVAPAAAFGLSLFAFSSPFQILLGQVLRSDPDAPCRLCFPIVWRTMSRHASEVLKADGKPKMTLCDGLRINRRREGRCKCLRT
jgi:hypothetical protein